MTELRDSTSEPHHEGFDPEFMIVVISAGVFIGLVLITAFFVLRFTGTYFIPTKSQAPLSHLVLPATNAPPASVQGTPESSFIFAQQNSKACV